MPARFLSADLSIWDTACKWNRTTRDLCVWLPSLGVMCSKFTRFPARMDTSVFFLPDPLMMDGFVTRTVWGPAYGLFPQCAAGNVHTVFREHMSSALWDGRRWAGEQRQHMLPRTPASATFPARPVCSISAIRQVRRGLSLWFRLHVLFFIILIL